MSWNPQSELNVPVITRTLVEAALGEVGVDGTMDLWGWDPPCGQPTAPIGEAGVSHRAPTEGKILWH